MRRAIIGLLAALLLLTLPACGGGNSAGGAEEGTATVSGVVNRLGDFLVLLTDDGEYAIFDLGPEVDKSALEEGDQVTVSYTGELGNEKEPPVAVEITPASGT